MNLKKTARFASMLALSAGLALGATACNDDKATNDKSQEQTQADPSAAVKTAFEGLQSTTYTMTMTAGDAISGTFHVDVANNAQAGNMTIDSSVLGSEAGMGDGPMEIETITIGTDSWVKMPSLAALIGDDKWIHVNAENMDDFANVDMTESSKVMLDSLKDVKETGDNTYSVTIDQSALTAGFGGKATGETVTVDVILSDDGQLQSMTTTIPNAADGQELTVTIEFSAYGEPVTVEAPAAEDVIESSELGM